MKNLSLNKKNCIIENKNVGFLEFVVSGSYLILNTNSIIRVYRQNEQVAIFEPSCLAYVTTSNAKITINNTAAKIIKVPDFISQNSQANISNFIMLPSDSFLCTPMQPGFYDIFNALMEYDTKRNKADGVTFEYSCMMMYLLIWFSKYKKSISHGYQSSLSSKIYAKISENISKQWSLKEISKCFYMSESTMKRKLKTEGTTFSIIYINARMNYAKKLLKQTNLRIGTIAVMCGFAHVSYFVSCFKKTYGITPSNYQKNLLCNIIPIDVEYSTLIDS
nr:helix-turn-helix domain-containing protein [Vibrio parahaemolyticus]